MRRMAGLLHRAMEAPFADLRLFNDEQPLSEQVAHTVAAIEAFAAEQRVELDVQISPQAGKIASAMLGPIILNGLRNAIEASAAAASGVRRVELSIAINGGDHVVILISDTGNGAPDEQAILASACRGGHGFGLDLCRKIVSELGGELSLTNVPFGNGAILQVTIPVGRLMRHG